jgi:hypothetical protein
MRTIAFAVMVMSLTVVAGAQRVGAPKLNFLADQVQQDGDSMRLHGHIRIAACSVVTADEGVLDFGTNEAALSGNVRMKLTNGVDRLRVDK